MKIQILKECPGKNHYDAHNMFNGKRAFNNRYKDWNNDKHCFNSYSQKLTIPAHQIIKNFNIFIFKFLNKM